MVNKERVKKLLRRGMAFALVIGLAAGYRVMNPGSAGVEPTGSVDEVTNWGLSFQKEGEPPVGNATAAELAKYDAWYMGDTGKKTIYLTFDGGYENGYTGEILDTLKKHQVPAAFFLVGTYIRDNPELVKRMVVLFSIFLRTLHTVFHSGCINLHLYQCVLGFPFFHILANSYYLLSFLQ